MPRFKFRLEAALRLAERALEEERRRLAEECEALRLKQIACTQQEIAWRLALDGQREAGIHEPQSLGRWQEYAVLQLKRLRGFQHEVVLQEERVEQQRLQVLEVHQEREKLKKLKGKQEAAFWIKEQRREQQVLDEAGQVIFNRLQQEQQEIGAWEGTRS